MPSSSTASKSRNRGKAGVGTEMDNSTGNYSNPEGMSGVLRVAEPLFNLAMAASAARRTSPRLILATGERRKLQDALWLYRRTVEDKQSSADVVGYVTRGLARPGTRTPAWRGTEDGVFWLSLEGLEDPALYVGLEDKRARTSTDSLREGEGALEDAIMGEALISVPPEGVRAGSRAFEVKLKNGAGSVTLQWSTHKDSSDSKIS